MITLGLDPAQRTGLAIYDTSRSLSGIVARVLKSEGDSFEEKASSIGRQLVLVIRELEKNGHRPDLVAIEAPLRQKVGLQKPKKVMGMEVDEDAGSEGGGLNAVISSNQITAAIVTAVVIKGLPWVMLSPATWRKSFLGYGRRPGWDRKDWKRAVRDQCARERITVTNDDQADAVGVAVAARASARFREIEYELSRRAA